MNCYKWELEALLKGLELKKVDERENNAELAANLRYTLNAKRVSMNKLFDKRKEEGKVINLFEGGSKRDIRLAERIQIANDYFRNKNKK